MKTIAVALMAAAAMGPTFAQKTTRVDGHFKKDGTYVAPHTRTTPNSTTLDNYSTKGNTNPLTGKQGTKSGN